MSAKIFGSVCGYVANEVQEMQTPKGTQYLAFSMAMTKKAEDGKNVVTAWIKAQMFGQQLTEFVRKTVKKGSYVVVTGEIKARAYLQKKDNTNMVAIDVNATAIDVPKLNYGQTNNANVAPHQDGTEPF